jgi:hypothetical protein
MSGAASGEKCQTCFGEGDIPTDVGPASCPDCGGAGVLPDPYTLVEWRVREIEQVHGADASETANALRWLAFEVRRARAALTELLTLSDEIDESPARTRMRFIANRGLSLYDVTEAGAAKGKR